MFPVTKKKSIMILAKEKHLYSSDIEPPPTLMDSGKLQDECRLPRSGIRAGKPLNNNLIFSSIFSAGRQTAWQSGIPGPFLSLQVPASHTSKVSVLPSGSA